VIALAEAAGVNVTPEAGTTAADPAEQLTAKLKLAAVGRRVIAARVVGRGSRASVDIYLDEGEIHFERFGDLCTARKLNIELITSVGANPKADNAAAAEIAQLVRTVAEHQETATADDIALEWGVAFLREATVLDVNLDDQGERWGAFAGLRECSPWGLAQMSGGTIAQHSLVLRHSSGERLIRASWFHSHVRTRESGVGAPEVAERMVRVGWTRRGGRGRVKASHPSRPESLAFAFHIVPEGWEDRT
jgi:hypothetical protein